MKPTPRLREAIEFIKIQNDLTNDDLSLALGYKTKSYVSDILGGSKLITRLFLDRLKAYYKINPQYILGGTPEMIVENVDSNFPQEIRNKKGASNIDELQVIDLISKSTERLEADHSRLVRSHEMLIETKVKLATRLLSLGEPGGASSSSKGKGKSSKNPVEDLPDKSDSDSEKSRRKQKGILKN